MTNKVSNEQFEDFFKDWSEFRNNMTPEQKAEEKFEREAALGIEGEV